MKKAINEFTEQGKWNDPIIGQIEALYSNTSG